MPSLSLVLGDPRQLHGIWIGWFPVSAWIFAYNLNHFLFPSFPVHRQSFINIPHTFTTHSHLVRDILLSFSEIRLNSLRIQFKYNSMRGSHYYKRRLMTKYSLKTTESSTESKSMLLETVSPRPTNIRDLRNDLDSLWSVSSDRGVPETEARER